RRNGPGVVSATGRGSLKIIVERRSGAGVLCTGAAGAGRGAGVGWDRCAVTTPLPRRATATVERISGRMSSLSVYYPTSPSGLESHPYPEPGHAGWLDCGWSTERGSGRDVFLDFVARVQQVEDLEDTRDLDACHGDRLLEMGVEHQRECESRSSEAIPIDRFVPLIQIGNDVEPRKRL